MTDDDEYGRSGISGAAGFLLGRMTAESSQSSARLAAAVRRRFSPPSRLPYDADDVDDAIATWEAAVARRDAASAQLQTQLNDASASNEALRQQVEECHRRISVLLADADDYATRISIRDTRLEGFLDEIAELKSEIERLKGES